MPNIELLYEDEEFRRIYYNGVETNYMISNYGRVWSDNRNIIMSNKEINSIIYNKYQFEATTLAANLRKRMNE